LNIFPGNFLNAISCSSVGNCSAIGQYVDINGNNQAMAATETSGTWAQATAVTAPANPGNSGLLGISCSSVGNCTDVAPFAVEVQRWPQVIQAAA
jgi:hypothetical protein